MKPILRTVLSICTISLLFGTSKAQQLPIINALKEFEKLENVQFQYSPSILNIDESVLLPVEGSDFEEKMHHLLAAQPVDWEKQGNIIQLLPTKTKYTISGYVKDAQTGEVLIGANIWDARIRKGISSNVYGFYSLTLPKGKHTIQSSFIGYQQKDTNIILQSNTRVDLSLQPDGESIEVVEVIISEEPDLIPGEKLGSYTISTNTIKNLPSLMGEADGIKAVQAMPGVKSVGEGSSGMFIRGGGQDQNLILLDEAPVYNPAHILGFLSVFNSDALKHVKLYTGGIPASYGGRLSSMLDIRMKEGNEKKWVGSGGIGLLAARLTVEGPLVKEKSSLLFSLRRSYLDLPYRIFARDVNLWFGDMNAKWNYRLNKKNRIYASGYFGGDQFQINQSYSIQWGNRTGTLRWNHIFSDKLFSNFSLIYSGYNYQISIPLNEEDRFKWNSGVRDLNAKADFDWYLSPSMTLLMGANAIQHEFDLGIINNQPKTARSMEYATYAHMEHKVSNKLKLDYGIRMPYYQYFAQDTVYHFNATDNAADTQYYDQNTVLYDNLGLEPRVKITWAMNDRTGIKFSYSRNRQYLQLLTNSSSGFTSFDLWFPSNHNVPVQIADQIAAGISRELGEKLTFSLDAYYKDLKNQVDYIDHALLVNNPLIESQLRTGAGYAYGLEFFLAGNWKKADIQMSYTYARTFRKIEGINDGNRYPALFDRPHDAKINVSYPLSDYWRFGLNWVYATGRAATLPIGVYDFGDYTVPIYSDRNAERLPDYHRMDLSATFTPKAKKDRKIKGEWVFSVLNVYNRHNTFALNFGRAVDQYGHVVDPKFDHVRDNAVSRTYLFGVLPSVTYNFKF